MHKRGGRSAASKLISDSPEQIQKMHVVESASLSESAKEKGTGASLGAKQASRQQAQSAFAKGVHYSRKSPKCAHALFLLSQVARWNYECCERNMQQRRPASFITRRAAQTLRLTRAHTHVINAKVVGCFCKTCDVPQL